MLTTKLILDRLDRRGRLLERREQPSRSFTLGFIQLLYVAHANIQNASPYYMADVDKANQDVDTEVAASLNQHVGKANLMLGAPPGLSQVICSPGIISPPSLHQYTLLGQHIGIQVGVGTTAVTPTDFRLEQKIGHGRRAPDGAPVVFESVTTGDTTDYEMYADRWAGAFFVPDVSHRVTSVRLKIYKEGSPGDLTVVIQGGRWLLPGGTGLITRSPSGVDLVSGTIAEGAMPSSSPGAFTECTFGTPVDVYAGHMYFIIAHITGGSSANSVHWRRTGTYTKRNEYLSSLDGGSSWSLYSGSSFLFEDKGQSVGEFEIGGCELTNLVISNPNGQFTLRRYFTNHCGQSITVNEAGLYMVGTDYSQYASPFLAGRDIVSPGVAVADGELLRVTYVPQITV